jgi:hypothetical protein
MSLQFNKKDGGRDVEMQDGEEVSVLDGIDVTRVP